MKNAYTFSGDLRSLPAAAVNDSRSVAFGANHDTIKEVNDLAINPYKREKMELLLYSMTIILNLPISNTE